MNLNEKEFLDIYDSGKSFFLYKVIPADLFTPVFILNKISKISPYHLLFESVTGGEKRGRYSILASLPDKIWKYENGKVTIGAGNNSFKEINEKPFDSLRKFQADSKIDLDSGLPQMAAGIFGFMGYDMVRLMETLPDKNPSNIDIPDSIFFRPQLVVIFDNILDKMFIISPVYASKKESGKSKFRQAKKIIDDFISNISKKEKIKFNEPLDQKIELTSHVEKQEYFNMVSRAKEYIKAGDIFQIVPSRRFSAKFKLPPISFYRALRSLNPSPYLFYVNLAGFTLIGSSPEILVKLKDGKVTIRPIAGTRKRGTSEESDLLLEKELMADQKEIAEHLMLLDLGRNDVGRVAVEGTVKVTEKMFIERYSHVMHIVSNVEGDIKPGKDFLDSLIAGFPAGTVSGAPKIRAMQIIEELESERRQFYAGAVGYISHTGNMDVCIALRTALIKDGKIYMQAGGGVVYDSTEEGEFNETQNKVAALIKAAEIAQNYV